MGLQEELQINPAVLEMVEMGVKTLFLMHLAACLWHYSAVLELPDSDTALAANVTLQEARAEAAMGTWLQYFAPKLQAGQWPGVMETYTASMYWALTTMSTIGYGDIRSITNFERVVSIIVMLVGSVIFGIVVGGMTNVMEQMNWVRMRATEKQDTVKAMLRERGIPQALILRTKQYYNHYLLECSDVATEQRILAELCPPLRTEVLLFLNARTVESIHFFRGQDSTFIVSVCKMLKPCFFAPHDWIFKEGELGLEMYFMQMGSVSVICYIDDQEIVLDTLESGSYFGEVRGIPPHRLASPPSLRTARPRGCPFPPAVCSLLLRPSVIPPLSPHPHHPSPVQLSSPLSPHAAHPSSSTLPTAGRADARRAAPRGFRARGQLLLHVLLLEELSRSAARNVP